MSATAYDVVVVGNVGIDTNVYFYGRDIDFSVEANFTEDLDCIGQAGGYASRGYTRLGRRTAFIGTVGENNNGRFIRETFEQEGIGCEGMFLDPQGTSRSVNLMFPDGRRKNFYDGKGHMNLQPPLEVCKRVLNGARLAHFNIPNWARGLLQYAKQAGVKIAVDLQDLVDLNDPYRQDFIDAADILFFSAANQADPRRIVEALLRRKPELVVVSGMGAQGCLLGTSDSGIRHFEPIQMDQPVVDTNGAGDSLAVGFLSSFVLENLPLEEAILRGQIAARVCCTLKGDSAALISEIQLEALANEYHSGSQVLHLAKAGG